ncbi:MAG: DUF308 domain-containing protein [Chitinophagaceae bacterium]
MANQAYKFVRERVKYWYVPLLVGIFFIILGLYVFSQPLSSFLALAILFSVSFIITGLIEIIFSISNRHELDNWGWMLTFGIIGVIAGILLISNPALSLATLSLYIGFLVLFRSIAAISVSIDMRNYGASDWGFILTMGILGVILAFILLWNPLFAGLSLVYWIALSFIAAGMFSIYFSVILKKLKKKID